MFLNVQMITILEMFIARTIIVVLCVKYAATNRSISVKVTENAWNVQLLLRISNLLLLACFSLGIIFKHCSDDEDILKTCSTYIGTRINYFNATMLVLMLALSMMMIAMAFIVVLAIQKFRTPGARMVSNGQKPILELPNNCKFHVFASHVAILN